jgi:hypothetical protein
VTALAWICCLLYKPPLADLTYEGNTPADLVRHTNVLNDHVFRMHAIHGLGELN